MKHAGAENGRYRLLFLMLFLSLSIGDSFNVLYAVQMAKKSFPPEVQDLYVNLSYTLMLVMTVVGIAASGVIIKRIGSLPRYLRLAAMMVFFGMLICGGAGGYWMMTAGFMLNGFGFGLAYVGIRYLAFLHKEQEKRLFTLSFVSGGAFVGECIGTILGGILAGQIEYRMVYFLAAILSLPSLLTLLKAKDDRIIEIGKASELKQVLKNKRAMLFLIFVVLPVFTSGAFLSYMVPMDVVSFGYSETVVAAMILMEYILAAYLGPLMTGWMQKKVKPLTTCFLLALLYGVPMLFYCAFRNMGVLIVSLILFGIGDSFGLNIVLETFNRTKGKSAYHENNALIVYILVSRLGISLSPSLLTLTGNPMILATLILGCVTGYCVIGRMKSNQNVSP